MRFRSPSTPEELARQNRTWVVTLSAGVVLLLWDLFRSIRAHVPLEGWERYLAGPIFSHKLSEIMLLALWMPVLWIWNYERAGLRPPLLTPTRHRRLLQGLLILAPIQIILATYAWTLANFGTNPRTTGFLPLVLGENGWIWRHYLGVIVLVGAAFIPFAARALARISSSPPAS